MKNIDGWLTEGKIDMKDEYWYRQTDKGTHKVVSSYNSCFAVSDFQSNDMIYKKNVSLFCFNEAL